MNRLSLFLMLTLSFVYTIKSNPIETLLEQKEEAIKISEVLKIEAKLVTEELRKLNKTQLADAIDEATIFVENLENQVIHTHPINEASIATLTRLLEVLTLAETRLEEELKKAFNV